jgi:hypothetical protein
VKGFTIEQIVAVLEDHHPRTGWMEARLECSCSGKWIDRVNCFYCRGRLPNHAPECSRPDIDEAGTKMREYVPWDKEHFLNQLASAYPPVNPAPPPQFRGTPRTDREWHIYEAGVRAGANQLNIKEIR